ncbi:MAG: low temperature requirement protein A [Hamadaea sp.]|uniref:low temperature requirement protein A n=1 Tax=Hamadaea sp. TaxID=2024425 RepID=UPI0018574E44|nr:low temperature requirement protein A [Hamadaea sp.]NUR73241.1 low temperature requirement protein A [Hamadaea sp.]NUT20244.1 low temperature requirement protein A [Hamadaea sp.]
MSNPAAAVEERHATWLELFFDLVIVAAVAQLAHLLHEDVSLKQIAVFAILYYAMWSVWTSFSLYANVRGDRVNQVPLLVAMFGIAVMAAAIPHAVHGHGNDYQVFVLAYVLCRVLAALTWKRSNLVPTDWPAARQGNGVIPWIVSLWLADSRYWWWFAGIALDIVTSFVLSLDPDKQIAAEQKEQQKQRDLWIRRLARILIRRLAPDPRIELQHLPDLPDIKAAQPNVSHLGERLGLFVIIVLGEAVAQLVGAAAGVPEWGSALWLSVIAGFGLLVAIWYLTLQYGSSSLPNYGARTFALRLTLPAHYVMTGAIVAISAGLGLIAAHPEGHLPTSDRWILCAGTAIYFLTATITGARGGVPVRWVLGWGFPAVAFTLLLGTFGGPLPGWAVAAILVVIALWHISYRVVDPEQREHRITQARKGRNSVDAESLS